MQGSGKCASMQKSTLIKTFRSASDFKLADNAVLITGPSESGLSLSGIYACYNFKSEVNREIKAATWLRNFIKNRPGCCHRIDCNGLRRSPTPIRPVLWLNVRVPQTQIKILWESVTRQRFDYARHNNNNEVRTIDGDLSNGIKNATSIRVNIDLMGRVRGERILGGAVRGRGSNTSRTSNEGAPALNFVQSARIRTPLTKGRTKTRPNETGAPPNTAGGEYAAAGTGAPAPARIDERQIK
ncbi:hypothetical protein EVAR_45519_1 [Eumeta japonica]|uniref:Uncharacterized protein n=1 Tax=Eumeta variegata TaxID=151549 RepID=A0A4C1XAI7_EUMVA|nr:hypothetical protein EVAR_45519_1 [Eumeta japonica]